MNSRSMCKYDATYILLKRTYENEYLLKQKC